MIINKKVLKLAGVVHTILNHSRTIEILLSLLYLNMKQMHSRDITTLIVLLWFSTGSVQYSSLFQYFLSIYCRLYSV